MRQKHNVTGQLSQVATFHKIHMTKEFHCDCEIKFGLWMKFIKLMKEEPNLDKMRHYLHGTTNS